MTISRKRLIISVACGVLCALLLALYASDVQAKAASSRSEALARYGGEQIEVLVAARDIAAGETLDETNMSAQIWLSDLLPQGVLTQKEAALGKIVAVSMLKNEPISEARLAKDAASVKVPDGFCALSVPTADVQAVGGAIAAGSTVNVYAVGSSGISLIGHELLVLETSNGTKGAASGQTAGNLFGGATMRANLQWVTLAVDPAQVQEIIAAAHAGNLYLVLPGAGVDIKAANVTTEELDATAEHEVEEGSE